SSSACLPFSNESMSSNPITTSGLAIKYATLPRAAFSSINSRGIGECGTDQFLSFGVGRRAAIPFVVVARAILFGHIKILMPSYALQATFGLDSQARRDSHRFPTRN